jgi:hypothetical protein
MTKSCPSVPDARHKGGDMLYILLWLLGVPLSLILILFLVGIGR